jgi:NSS family neurotransmitter:Na+ symporter
MRKLLTGNEAIGLGNVWRFPFIAGRYGGGAFVLIYLIFLVCLAMPVMVMEFSVGRASQRSIVGSFECSWYGWGWDNFIAEANAGKGAKIPPTWRFYFTWLVPVAIAVIFVFGYIEKFF